MSGLVKEIRADKNGRKKAKYVRPPGVKSPSAENSHRRKYVKSVRLKCLAALGGKCVRCGYDSDVRALQIDHINSDGIVDRTGENRTKTGGSYYHLIWRNIISGSDRYQVLRANCNVIMRDERQECLHKFKFKG